MRFSIICASHDENKLASNLLKSPKIEEHELLILRNYSNVPKAYNKGASETSCPIQIFVHHDVFLPKEFFDNLSSSISLLPSKEWGLLGVAGKTSLGKDAGYVLDRDTIFGDKDNLPVEVQTLDELLLVKHKDNYSFDEKIPSSHHLFGTDLCFQYKVNGYRNYALSAYCLHNSDYEDIIPSSWSLSAEYLRNKWKDYLPIQTTCGLIE